MSDEQTSGKKYLIGQEGIPGQGSFMLLILQVNEERIVDVKFQAYPCPAAHACGTFTAEWLVGKTFLEASAFDESVIEASIGKMPLGREHCPALAANALRQALAQKEADTAVA